MENNHFLCDFERSEFHKLLISSRVLSINSNNIASNADKSQKFSIEIAGDVARKLGVYPNQEKLQGQTAGKLFEDAVSKFIESTFPNLSMLRPGTWIIENVGSSRKEYHISQYSPYKHLKDLSKAITKSPNLRAALGNGYDISPDVLVLRNPESDDFINQTNNIVSSSVAQQTPIRLENNRDSIVHAVISCKWTLRSARAQNARSEALNIIRNRKGRTPHIVVVTGEPTPSRLASLALGTGDIDTIYHFALYELISAINNSGNSEAQNILETLISGERLRDISDLPFDMAI